MTIFETQRLVVRQLTEGDAENFYILNSDPEVMRYIRAPKTRIQATQFLLDNIDYYEDFPVFGRWALVEKANNQFIGSFMLRPSVLIENRTELGYAMFRHRWGQGFATESVKGGLEYAFGTLKLPSVIAITQKDNMASKKVLLKSGFTQIDNVKDQGRIVNLFSLSNESQS
ncbi:MAG TPA: GNAT family N-acetyltransferase [Puia sp.]|nr:GNAT family N-acetyltransferase [Puia sp.]